VPGRRLALVAGGLMALLLATFILLEPILPAAIANPPTWQTAASPRVAVAAVTLLAADVVLPIPSSLVMLANGAIFGVLLGTALSTLGAMSSALVAFGIGRSAQRRTRAWLGAATTARLDRLLARHGIAALIATRPIPIVAETVAVLAGSGRLRTRSFIVGTLAGSLATSFIYAAAGAAAADGNAWLAVPAATAIAAVAWVVGRRARQWPSVPDIG
jgi:uncharacterized membrane protein YdjX (TVP38/TMEM64 family)